MYRRLVLKVLKLVVFYGDVHTHLFGVFSNVLQNTKHH